MFISYILLFVKLSYGGTKIETGKKILYSKAKYKPAEAARILRENIQDPSRTSVDTQHDCTEWFRTRGNDAIWNAI